MYPSARSVVRCSERVVEGTEVLLTGTTGGGSHATYAVGADSAAVAVTAVAAAAAAAAAAVVTSDTRLRLLQAFGGLSAV